MKLFIAIISLFLISVSTEADKEGFYKYCDGYTFKYIELKKDKTFLYYNRSCTGVWETKGNWTTSGDSIFLDHEVEKRDTLLYTNGQLLIRLHNKFTDFEPYSKMKIKNTTDKKDCCESCYKRFKKQR